MKLHELRPAPGSRHSIKRVGRGPGSGLGKTSGRGHKGQKARSGGSLPPWFEGGQMPLQRRLPKRGFTNIFTRRYEIVNVGDLDVFAANTAVTPALLGERRLIRGRGLPVKILGDGELSKALTVQAHRFSKTAVEKIRAAGGQVQEA